MKRKLFAAALLLAAVLAFASSASALNAVDNYLYTDIVAEINGHPVRSYNVDDHMAVVAEDLRPYGFYAIWNAEDRTLSVLRAVRDQKPETPANWPEYIQPPLENIIGMPAGEVYETDIKTYVAGNEVNAFNIDGETLIWFRDLAPLGIVNWNEAERKAELTLADPVDLAFAPVIEGVDNWKQTAGEGSGYDIYEAACGKLLVYTYSGTPHGSSTSMLFVKHTGEQLLINSLLPNAGLGNSYYLHPSGITIDGNDRLNFTGYIREMSEDLNVTDLGECLVTVDLHSLELLSIQPVDGKIENWECSLTSYGPADGAVLSAEWHIEQGAVSGSVTSSPGEGITISINDSGLTLIHDQFFLTGGESDQDYLKLFGELKELGVRDMTEEGSSQEEPQAEDQEMLARERISLKLNGEEIKGSLSLSQGNAGRYIYLEFTEPLVLTAGDELILTVR